MGQARTYMYGYTELFMHMFLELSFNLPMNWYDLLFILPTILWEIIMVGDDEYFVTLVYWDECHLRNYYLSTHDVLHGI